MAVIDSYPSSNYSGNGWNIASFAPFLYLSAGSTFWLHQKAYQLTSARFYLQWSSAPATSGSIRAKVYLTYGLNASQPYYSMNPVAVSDPLPASSVGGIMAYYTFTFSGNQSILLTENYYIVMIENTSGNKEFMAA